jgi:E3 ubiquitin-protein ligase UBR1
VVTEADDRCGAATGIFLDVKRCSLIVLFAGTGSFLNAPYLDEHGDPDGGGLK